MEATGQLAAPRRRGLKVELDETTRAALREMWRPMREAIEGLQACGIDPDALVDKSADDPVLGRTSFVFVAEKLRRGESLAVIREAILRERNSAQPVRRQPRARSSRSSGRRASNGRTRARSPGLADEGEPGEPNSAS